MVGAQPGARPFPAGPAPPSPLPLSEGKGDDFRMAYIYTLVSTIIVDFPNSIPSTFCLQIFCTHIFSPVEKALSEEMDFIFIGLKH